MMTVIGMMTTITMTTVILIIGTMMMTGMMHTMEDGIIILMVTTIQLVLQRIVGSTIIQTAIGITPQVGRMML